MYESLTDLLNQDPAAYTLFYSLPARMQEQLQGRQIHSLKQLHEAVSDLDTHQRPGAF